MMLARFDPVNPSAADVFTNPVATARNNQARIRCMVTSWEGREREGTGGLDASPEAGGSSQRRFLSTASSSGTGARPWLRGCAGPARSPLTNAVPPAMVWLDRLVPSRACLALGHGRKSNRELGGPGAAGPDSRGLRMGTLDR